MKPVITKTVAVVGAVLIMFGGMISQAKAQIITVGNPNFTANSWTGADSANGTITDWGTNPLASNNPFPGDIGLQTQGGGNIWDNGLLPGGTKVAYIQSNGQAWTSYITQTISGLTSGLTYDLSFYYNGANKGYNSDSTLFASMGGTEVGTPIVVTPVNADGAFTNPFDAFDVSFVATGSSEVLEIANTATVGNSFLMVSDVGITEEVVVDAPEPSTMALLVVTAMAALLVPALRRRARN